METLRDKRVLVVGLGRSGVAAARFCATGGAKVAVCDMKQGPELSKQTAELEGLGVEFYFGQTGLPNIVFDLLVASPGVPLDIAGIAAAKKRGAPVIGEMELAVRELRRPVIAVTGTNGKSTATALTGHLLESAGIKATIAGNIGVPVLDVVDEANSSEAVVLEVSSFQIETTPSLKPHIAILLNITGDHLDRHKTLDAYAECKARLFSRVGADGFGIYNGADMLASQYVVASGCKLIPFDATGRTLSGAKDALPCHAWFGGGDLWVRTGGASANRYSLDGVNLTGLHNRENMLASLAACELMGAPPDLLSGGLKSFKGLPHRMEFVCEHRGVKFFDDSKGTNIGATIRAIESCAEPVVLVAGGLSKGVDLSPLADAARGRVKKAVLIGESAGELERRFSGVVETVRAVSMDEAVLFAFGSASPGDIVLLSPACASFDMFRDYADRGEKFANAARKLGSNLVDGIASSADGGLAMATMFLRRLD